jgi:ABC-2 type transport system ATP-binding protein
MTDGGRPGWLRFLAPPGRASADPVVMEGVSRQFGELLAIERISLTVQRGTILGLIGPSGSGKTTTIRTLTGAIAPTSGTVRVLGEDPRRFRRRTRERIGYAPQEFVLYRDLTARENVDFVGALFGMLWRKRRRRVREVLTLLGLWDARRRRASQLSGGMQRRLELACAMVHQPELLFLDEPTAGIDPLLRQTVWGELRRLRDEGRTVLVTTQYIGEAEYCDRVALLSGGRLVAAAAPAALRRQALGGDVVEVETAGAVDAARLGPIPSVVHARQRGPRQLLFTAQDAGEATPRILEALKAKGVEVVSSREYRPTFDEVFAELVRSHRAGRAEAEADAQSRDGNGRGEPPPPPRGDSQAQRNSAAPDQPIAAR